MSETETLATVVRTTEFEDLPEAVVTKANEAILDYLGVALYGSRHEAGEHVAAYVSDTGGDGAAPMIGREKTAAPGAALANGTFGHAIDYDDTFESLVLHPTSPVFGAAFAASGRTDVTGKSLLTAYTVGIETAYRVGRSVYPAHYDHGWHITGTVGTLGATAATASILDLSVSEIRHALGIAAASSSALKKNFGSMTKPLHAGHAAQSGVRAALLAERGFTADPNILDGDLGYGTVMSPGGTYDPDVIEAGHDEWGVLDIGYKPYPSGVITHAAMDALRDLVLEHDLEPEDVDRVVVTLDDAASEMLHHENPENALQAKFSIEFCLASVLREREVGLAEFTDDYVTDETTRSVMDLVERDFEANLFEGPFANYGARVTVETLDGETLVGRERFAPGSPNNPLSRDRLERKFREGAAAVLDPDEIESVLDALEGLEEPGSLDRLRSTVIRA